MTRILLGAVFNSLAGFLYISTLIRKLQAKPIQANTVQFKSHFISFETASDVESATFPEDLSHEFHSEEVDGSGDDRHRHVVPEEHNGK